MIRLAMFLVAASVSAADFDQGVGVEDALRDAVAAPAARVSGAPGVEPALPVWVSLDRADLSRASAAGIVAAASVEEGSGPAVLKLSSDELSSLSETMHETTGRCGGFFAFRTQEEAAVLPRAASATKGASYVVDQQGWTKPVVARVAEPELRATIETLAAYQNRYYQSDTGVAAAQWIRSRWAALAAGMPAATTRLVAHEGWKQPSVVLTIPGTDKADEIVILGGHLDSINGWSGARARAPGADDNASGIAVLTEAIRVLGAAGFKPRRTVEFMGYAAEEVGLRGSQDIAKSYAAAGKKVVGVVQFDMTGFKGSAESVFLLTDNVDPGLTDFLGRLTDVYLGVTRGKTACGYGCSDHASWTKSGFPASAAFEAAFKDMNDNIHSEKDTLANSGGDASHDVPFAKLAAAFAAEMAKVSAPGRSGW